jgi:hypothetical protein
MHVLGHTDFVLLEIDLLLKHPTGVWFLASDYGSCKYVIVLETAIKFIKYLYLLAVVGVKISGKDFFKTTLVLVCQNTASFQVGYESIHFGSLPSRRPYDSTRAKRGSVRSKAII